MIELILIINLLELVVTIGLFKMVWAEVERAKQPEHLTEYVPKVAAQPLENNL